MYRGCPAGTHPCAPDAQAVWHRSQSANSCCAELCCVVVCCGASHTRSVEYAVSTFCTVSSRRFDIIIANTTLPILIVLAYLSRHSGNHWCFQFLACVLDAFFEFRILRVNEIDPSQFSCVFKVELFVRPFLLLLQLDILSHCCPDFWP